MDKKYLSFEDFQKGMVPFDEWKADVKLAFPDSADESLAKIYKSQNETLYRLYKVCCDLKKR